MNFSAYLLYEFGCRKAERRASRAPRQAWCIKKIEHGYHERKASFVRCEGRMACLHFSLPNRKYGIDRYLYKDSCKATVEFK